jgi:hypothetical protein
MIESPIVSVSIHFGIVPTVPVPARFKTGALLLIANNVGLLLFRGDCWNSLDLGLSGTARQTLFWSASDLDERF